MLPAYVRGLTIELKKYSAEKKLLMRQRAAGHTLLHMWWRMTLIQVTPGRMVRKETTVTIHKVTVSVGKPIVPIVFFHMKRNDYPLN